MSKKRFKYADFCQSCRKVLANDDKIVYVEESSNRFFCNEKCIRAFYDPMSEFYKTTMLGIRDAHDIPESDFAAFESYAPLCLSNPYEVWLEENENGESIHFFMANFMNEGGKFTYIVMCFCLELEPTYLLLSFPTRDKKMVEEFRRGEQLEISNVDSEVNPPSTAEVTAGLKDDFLSRQGQAIEEDMLRHRSATDIPKQEFEEYAHLLEQTIENPNEVWELQDEGENTLLTLISQEDENLHYIVICTYDEQAEGRESWRVIYSFPTRDLAMVQRYRRGVLREGSDGSTSSFLH